MSWLERIFSSASSEIDRRIEAELRSSTRGALHAHVKAMPSYRFVDLHRAVTTFCSGRDSVTIESEHDEDLNNILHGQRQQWMPPRRIKRSGRMAWPTGPGEEVYLPTDCFWVCPISGGSNEAIVVRLRYVLYRDHAQLEIASTNPKAAAECLDEILRTSVENSVYRNRLIEMAFEVATKDEDGDVERPERLRVLFKRTEAVEERDFIVDDEVREMLQRNVIDLQTRRELLKAHGVPVRRGVLLFGPPGTGKTFACRYLCGQLPETTRIMVTGTALLQVNAIFSLARMLQPSILFLEDVDLVFASREINLYSSVLGDLLDQMDGLRPFEDVGFVLTTNAIDRMEAAIKDRPGRISQCIHFGPPEADLRQRYMAHYLRASSTDRLDLDRLVAESQGATQAFLKEWVHRAVQIASERIDSPDDSIVLENDDFTKAMAEMRRFTSGSTGSIIGFHG